ncbi:MAG: hypothetical protein OEW90_14690 [Betaproteobacteria bacterium]|nr:hypothetical protein [Betaproteobacteria bacterium]
MSQQINLFNPLFMRKKKYFSARTMLQSLGLIALGMLAIYAYALWQASDLRQLAASYSGQLAAQRAQFVSLSGQGRSKLLEAEAARLEGDLRVRRGVLDVMQGGAGLGNTSGFSRFFAAFARHPMRGVWLTGFSVGDNGNVLNVRGRVLHADLVPEYLKLLNKDDVMRGRLVTELKLVARDESGVRRSAAAGVATSPSRFIEFDLSAPLRLADAGGSATKAGR